MYRGSPQDTELYQLQKLHYPDPSDTTRGIKEKHRGNFRPANSNLPVLQPSLERVAVCPQVAVAQCRLADRGYVGRVICLEHQPDVAGNCWHGVHAQAEEK